MPSTTRAYELHGRHLSVHAPGRAATLLDHVFSAYVADAREDTDLELTLELVDRITRPSDLRHAGRAEDGTEFHHAADGGLVVEVAGLGLGIVHPDGRRAVVRILHADPDWQTGHRLVEPVVVELLRSRGLFGIHAACVARDGGGLLLCGRSGSGKSTAALALARSGWGFLGDDTCYADGASSPPRLRARWSDVHVTEASLAVVIAPEDREAAFRPEGSEKYFLPVRGLRSLRPVTDCAARWLVFPEIVDAETAVLTPLSGEEALARLVTQSLLPGREEAAKAHFDALVALCAGVSSYRLEAGRDLGALVREIGRLTGD